jgi:serine/threonine protein kinase
LDQSGPGRQAETPYATELPSREKTERTFLNQGCVQTFSPIISNKLQQIEERLDISLFDVLDRLITFDIPSVNLPGHGVVSTKEDAEWRALHPLGAGHSGAVVQHTMTNDLSLKDTKVLKAGTLIALKLFNPISGEEGDTSRSRSQTPIYKAILKELTILSHPRLRSHENICQLLCICWLDDSDIPALALELATFGSLEDILVAPGYGLSTSQKINITVDIALGLATIHACGLAHGDLKPGNVVLFQHETRQIVAKITDFGGSGTMALNTSQTQKSGPVLATPAWSAPEVVYREKEIDWQKADSYAYGIIVASIWSRPEQFLGPRSSSCVLETMLAVDLDVDQKRDILLLLKLQADTSETSVIRLCCQWIRCRDGDIHDLLCNIVCRTLCRDSMERTCITSLLSTFIQGLSDHTSQQYRYVRSHPLNHSSPC